MSSAPSEGMARWLAELESPEPGVRAAAVEAWEQWRDADRLAAIDSLVGAVRAARQKAFDLDRDDFARERHGDHAENTEAVAEVNRRQLLLDEALRTILRREVLTAARQCADRDSLLRLVRLLVRECQGWRYGGWAQSPVIRFLEPALAWAEGEGACDLPAWRWVAEFLVAGCPVAPEPQKVKFD